MSKRKKHEEHEEHVNHERWLITYADMITLLMVLFIVLFAIGQTDLKKFQKLAGGTKNALGGGRSDAKPKLVTVGGQGILEGGQTPIGDLVQRTAVATNAQSTAMNQTAKAAAQAKDSLQLQTAEKQIEAGLISKNVDSDVHLQIDPERGLVVTIVADKVLFDSGSASLTSAGAEVLDQIAPVLAGVPNGIEIEGHTDNNPISSSIFPSNWELSTGRAGSVLRYLGTKGVDESRMKASGYADTKPIVPNDSDAHKAQNRRVEIVVLSNTNSKAEGTGSG